MTSTNNLSKQARLKQNNPELDRPHAHAHMAVMLRDKSLRQSIINDAQKKLELWHDGNLCSTDYIEGWRDLLKQTDEAAEALESMSPASILLRKNSPLRNT